MQVVRLGDSPDLRPGGLEVQEKMPLVCSLPSITFSATVKGGMSMKCWWTMPMPAAIASPGPSNCARSSLT